MRLLACLLLFGSTLAAQNFPPVREIPAARADVMYYNANIITMNPEMPRAEAMTISGDRIRAVGTTQSVGRTIGPATKQIDLQGRTVLPGLIDSHVHPISAGLAERDGVIPVMRSFAELEVYVKEQLPKSEGLIFVPKVYSTRLAEQRYPTRQEMDAWSGDRPVMFDNGYAAALNNAALELAGVSQATPDPENGKIIRDEEGSPTGLILGARQLVSKLLQQRSYSFEDRLAALKKMQGAYNAVGITSVIDRGQNPEGMRVYQHAWERGELTVRSYVTRLVNAERPLEEIEREIRGINAVTGFGDEFFRIGSLKIFLDGGILIGTAFLRAPYGQNTQVYGFDDPDYRGELRVERETIAGVTQLAGRLGWQMTAHTTGGASSDALLDAYERENERESIRDKRFTLTHVNFPNADAISRAKKLGVVMDMQPAWYHFDGPAISKVIGPNRMKFFHPYRDIFDAGVIVAGGSDHMIKYDSYEAVNPFNPFFGMWMVVTRKAADGKVYNPEQKITREEALRMWTTNAAYLSFEEDVKGSLESGKYADFVVIDRDILTCPEDEIRDIQALEVYVGNDRVN